MIKENILSYKGSNFLRQRLVLSILSGKSVKITDIRKLEDEPGVKEFEVNLIRLLDKITNGTVVELSETGTSLYFQPGLLLGGSIEHDCSLQRGIGYYLEVLCMLGLFCKQPLRATLRGITNNKIDPSADLIKSSFLRIMKVFIIDDEGLDLNIIKRGVSPNGGGEVIFTCPTSRHIQAKQILDLGMIKRVRGTAFAIKVSPNIVNRMIDKSKGVLLEFLPDVYINTAESKRLVKCPGFGIHLFCESTTGVVYSAEQVSNAVVNGEEPTVPEDLGIAAANRLLQEIEMGGIVDSTTQSLPILFMALGHKDVSKIVLGSLTDYSIWLLRHLKDFFGVTYKLEYAENDQHSSGNVILTCVGIGFTNISKRTL